MKIAFALATCAAALGCRTPTAPGSASPEGRLRARPGTTAAAIQPGEHRLGLTTGRDATLYIPEIIASKTSVPLMVMLHGAGSSARNVSFTFPLADEFGVVILAPESRSSTWDAVRDGFGPDVAFIDQALGYTFQRVNVSPKRLAIGGFSDGASYALSLGLANGDVFSHLIAFSPGFVAPAPLAGRPSVFISHGTQDQVLSITATSRRIVPRLRGAGYQVTYREFDGPHLVPAPIAREAFEWLTR